MGNIDIYYTNDIKQFKESLEKGTNIDNKDVLLAYACWGEDLEIVKLLLDYRADVNTRSGLPLIYACYYNNIEIIRLLLEYGADVSVLNIGKYSLEVREIINTHIVEKMLLEGK